MPWWYYKGRVTTPVDIPGKGPTVIKPRMKFEAPVAAVANLKRLGLVAECSPPVVKASPVEKKVEVAEPPKEAPAPKSDTGGVEKAFEGDAPGLSAVVASEPTEPEARVVEAVDSGQADEAEAEDEEKKEEEQKRSWRKKRR